ncbi:MAG: hypothetical protein KAQ83_04930, partial [Nanoarchaeota archaeon]|nr:hypothetical protein [Nanoarchaeota archaeon]
SFVGTHEIVVFVTDEKGAQDNQTLWLIINNTNDAPVIQDFEFPMIVETHAVNLFVYVNDTDYNLPSIYQNISVNSMNITNISEFINFSDFNISGSDLFNISTLFDENSNVTYGRISFTPGFGSAGNYTVNISIVDYAGVSDWLIKNFTILQREDTPNITHIRPYGGTYSNDTYFSFMASNVFYDNTTHVSFAENRSVIYAINVTDDNTPEENLSYEWYINEIFESNESYLNISYDFFSSGQYNISVYVEDERYEVSEWNWNVTVDNLNRPAILLNNLIDLNGANAIDSQSTFSNYLMQYPDTKFIDLDDDINGDNEIGVNETSTLSYLVDSCSYATIIITNHSITVNPVSIGVCNVS